MTESMSREEAVSFFAVLLGGEHHFSQQPKQFGPGWVTPWHQDLSTFDFSDLTNLVFLAHDRCVRASVIKGSRYGVQVAIWKRRREGGVAVRHPSLDDAVTSWRKRFPADNTLSRNDTDHGGGTQEQSPASDKAANPKQQLEG